MKNPSPSSISRLGVKGLLKNLCFHIIRRSSGEKHVFVLGPPRSGTTLIQKILTSHPAVCGIDDETFFFCRRRFDNITLQDIPSASAQDAFDLSHNKLDMFDRISAIVRGSSGASIFLEKTPEHALYLSELVRWYPNSIFVFMVRDGRDAYFSTMRCPEVHIKIGELYPKLWRDCVRQFLRNRHMPQVILCRYEDMCRDPESSVRAIMRKIELDFDSKQINPSVYSKTRVKKQQGHERLSEAISSKSVGQYQQAAFVKEATFFESIAALELEAMGYSVEPPETACSYAT